MIKEYKRGWRLGFCFGNEAPKYLPFWFQYWEDAKATLKFNAVVIHMKKGKENAAT